MKPVAAFNIDDYEEAYKIWGANCGPGAIAAITHMTLSQIRPFMGNYEQKHYTNPRLMIEILKRLNIDWNYSTRRWPKHGLVRIQWEGPWTDDGVPRRKRYRHTHWVASKFDEGETYIFDINCICVGGWVDHREWENGVVPWLLPQVEPEAYGTWHPTHRIEIKNPSIALVK